MPPLMSHTISEGISQSPKMSIRRNLRERHGGVEGDEEADRRISVSVVFSLLNQPVILPVKTHASI